MRAQIQVLEKGGGGGFATFNRWGRLGEQGQQSLKAHASAGEAIKDFEKKFNDKKEEVKQTNVQLTKIENLLKLKDKLDTQNDGTGYMSSLARAENEKVLARIDTTAAAVRERRHVRSLRH